MSQVKIFGIPNCDTVKKARKWLDEHGIDYVFHDFRKDGLTARQVNQWLDSLGIEQLVNKRSTTWKGLSDAQRNALTMKTAAALLCEHPTLIKRPVLELNVEGSTEQHVGFSAERYQSLFK